MSHRPRVTVAALIEREGRFLMVEERTESGVRVNQPAGHWEPDEPLLDAVVREAREETGYAFRPEAFVGVYHWPAGDDAYLRFVFAGEASAPEGEPELDPEILRTLWMTYEEIAACRDRHRGPQVLRCIDDWLSGRRLPLELFVELG